MKVSNLVEPAITSRRPAPCGADSLSSCSFEVWLKQPAVVTGLGIQQSGYTNRDIASFTVKSRSATSLSSSAYAGSVTASVPLSASLQSVSLSSALSGSYFLFQFSTATYQPYLYHFQLNGYNCATIDTLPNAASPYACGAPNEPYYVPIAPSSIASSLSGFYCTSSGNTQTVCGAGGCTSGCNDVTKLMDGSTSESYLYNPSAYN